MKLTLLFTIIILNVGSICIAQSDERISTMDFVQILNGNKKEALYYFQNNWKILREMAMEKGYIESYQFLEVPKVEGSFDFVFITTYPNHEKYEHREENFQELIKIKGSLKLLNEIQPSDFRKTLFSREGVRHSF